MLRDVQGKCSAVVKKLLYDDIHLKFLSSDTMDKTSGVPFSTLHQQELQWHLILFWYEYGIGFPPGFVELFGIHPEKNIHIQFILKQKTEEV